MLGPDCVLVHRTPSGFRCLSPAEAEIIQTALSGPECEPGWLFEQTRRICDALAKGEIALAQIYGLHLPIGELDGAMLCHLAVTARLLKANFDPSQPRVPRGEPGAGQWTYEPGYAKPRTHGEHSGAGDATASADEPREPGEGPASSEQDRLPHGGSDAPHIPAEPPGTRREINRVARQAAVWLRRAIALGAQVAPAPQVRAFLRLVETTWWLADNLPSILSYLDAPKMLEELQDAVSHPRLGYEIHHIIKKQSRSRDSLANLQRFRERLGTRENLVLIPRWRHVEISSWYSRKNNLYTGLILRKYLRGKSWEEQYEFGLEKPRDFGVLK